MPSLLIMRPFLQDVKFVDLHTTGSAFKAISGLQSGQRPVAIARDTACEKSLTISIYPTTL